jgi:hypothetical protein
MIIKYGRIALIVLTIGLFNALISEVVAQTSTQKTGSVNLQQVLSWLPADTETISVARAFDLDYKIPQSKPDEDENENRAVTDLELAEQFEALTANREMPHYLRESEREFAALACYPFG